MKPLTDAQLEKIGKAMRSPFVQNGQKWLLQFLLPKKPIEQNTKK